MNTNLNTITVTLDNGERIPCATGTTVRDVVSQRRSPDGLDYVGALVNNDAVSFTYPLEVDSNVTLLTRGDPHGFQIYRRSVWFLLAKTVKELFPDAHFAVEHSLGAGFFCSFEMEGKSGICDEQLQSIDQRMRAIVERDVPIEMRKIAFTEAVQRFEQEKQWDKYNLLRFRNPPKIATWWCENFSDLSHGPLASGTGALALFKLIPYPPGFVLQIPEQANPQTLPPFEPQPQLFQIFQEHKEWGRVLGVNTVGRLNEIIATREIGDFIKIAEAFHEKKIAQIADHINDHRNQIKWCLIAGPSSSGKTTFAKRLAVQLRVDGLRPVTISVDNYFVNREQTPRDKNGEPDFESIDTVDLPLFNDHLMRLDKGEEVDLPTFNFEKGCREFRGEKLRIEPGQIVLVEGIHGLNPRLTRSVPPGAQIADLHQRADPVESRFEQPDLDDGQPSGAAAGARQQLPGQFGAENAGHVAERAPGREDLDISVPTSGGHRVQLGPGLRTGRAQTAGRAVAGRGQTAPPAVRRGAAAAGVPVQFSQRLRSSGPGRHRSCGSLSATAASVTETSE